MLKTQTKSKPRLNKHTTNIKTYIKSCIKQEN